MHLFICLPGAGLNEAESVAGVGSGFGGVGWCLEAEEKKTGKWGREEKMEEWIPKVPLKRQDHSHNHFLYSSTHHFTSSLDLLGTHS